MSGSPPSFDIRRYLRTHEGKAMALYKGRLAKMRYAHYIGDKNYLG